MADPDEDGETRRRLRFVDRLEHFTWAWYTLPMSTGGIALLLAPQTQPHGFHGLDVIGRVVYVFDICLFVAITAAIVYRFTRWRHTFSMSLSNHTESLFFGAMLLALADIIAGIARYGIPSSGPWLVVAYRVLFWIYFAATFIAVVAQYTRLFISPKLKIQDMTPAWDLPTFPFMLSGTIAATGASLQPATHAVPMIVAGVTAQGLGMLVSILMFASYIRRMIQYGLPSPKTRPAMMIAVGPPSFTSLALLGMADAWPLDERYAFFGDPVITKQVLKIMATFMSIFIWSLAFWFLCVNIVAIGLIAKSLTFHLNWWALVFPNVGFTIAIISIGKSLKSEGVLWVGSVLTCLLIVLYLFILTVHIRAVLTKQIMWPGKDEDVYVPEAKGKLDEKGE